LPPAAVIPALALLGADGEFARTTEPFNAWLSTDDVPPATIWELLADEDERSRIGRVLAGALDSAIVTLSAEHGRHEVAVEAVTDGRGTRHALVIARPAEGPGGPETPVDALLGEAFEDSPAIVWLKGLDGRYLHVNRSYTEQLGLADDELQGRTDADLPARQTVDGPRLRRAGEPNGSEPLQLEYTVAAFEDRPALAALRFPVRGRNGEPVAICGVAAPVGDARLARAECARLLQIERWSRLGAEAIRAELLDEWGLVVAQAAESIGATVSGVSPGGAETARLEAELGRLSAELADARARAEQLALESTSRGAEHERALALANAELEAARQASAAAAQQLGDERLRLQRLHEASETAARRAHELLAAVTSEREHGGELERALERAHARATELEAELSSLRARAARTDETDAESSRAALAEAAIQAERSRAERAEAAAREGREQAERAEAAALWERERAGQAEAAALCERERAGKAEAAALWERERAEQGEAAALCERERAGKAEAAARWERERAEQGEAALQRAHSATAQLDEALERETARAEVLASALDRERQTTADTQVALDRATAELSHLAALRTELSSARAELDRARAEATGEGIPESADGEIPELSRSVPTCSAIGWSHPAQRRLTAILAGAFEWRTGLKDAVRILGADGGWDAVVAWCADERKPLLACTAMWSRAPDELALFATATWQNPQSLIGSGVGRASTEGDTIWVTELEAAEDRHLSAAASAGLKSALLVPLRSSAETIGVLELLTSRAVAPDPALIAALEAVALQLAHFAQLVRLGATPRWRLGRL
jgi:PAS domain-containing protein